MCYAVLLCLLQILSIINMAFAACIPKKIHRVTDLPRSFMSVGRMKTAKFTLIKTLTIFFQNFEFCKAQSKVKFWNILYLSHILVWIFPPFWSANLIFRRIPKDTKMPTNLQYFKYELVGWFYIICWISLSYVLSTLIVSLLYSRISSNIIYFSADRSYLIMASSVFTA